MGRAWIVLGDKTSHGGTVISASGFTSTGGRSVARVGDMTYCPKEGHGSCPIVSGDYTIIIDGQPIAREGDSTACGAILIASQLFTTIEPNNSKGSVTQEASFEDFFSPYVPQADETHIYDEQVTIIDRFTGKPLLNFPYRFCKSDGSILAGVTDESGKTLRVRTDEKMSMGIEHCIGENDGWE